MYTLLNGLKMIFVATLYDIYHSEVLKTKGLTTLFRSRLPIPPVPAYIV